jgi:hypothetical protein
MISRIYILENTPPPFRWGGISGDVIWGKNMKRGKKGENVKEKGRRERKRVNGK